MLVRAQPATTRATCAFVIPINPRGSTLSRHALRGFNPMPGSMRTGTMPALNRPKISAKKSRPGVTISAQRSPRRSPEASSPLATSPVSLSNCSKLNCALPPRDALSRCSGTIIAGCCGRIAAATERNPAKFDGSGLVIAALMVAADVLERAARSPRKRPQECSDHNLQTGVFLHAANSAPTPQGNAGQK